MSRTAGVLLLASLALVLSACGSTGSTRTVTVASPEPIANEATTTTDPPPAPTPHRRKRAPKPVVAMLACDQNIAAKVGTTSCPFAENVFWAYWHAWEAGDDAFTAYSPVTEQDYDMSCATPGSTVVCSATDGAEVRFAQSAVRAYTADQADRYEATHDTGPPAADEAPAPDAPGGSSEPSTDCDPNYEGACLDPNSYDYDCEGGSGDGPDYTGEVQIVGDDHFGLDRDGDGVACDW